MKDQIKTFEDGLLPPVVIKGEAPPGMTLDERMAHYRVPGVSIAVIDQDQIEWAKGYGSLQAGMSKPVQLDTLFQAASLSKPVAAMVALALVEQGELQLDQDVNIRLKSWKIPESVLTLEEKVTLRRLLCHTAGTTVKGFEGYPVGDEIPSLIQILDGSAPANSDPILVNLVPGSRWRASGGGYVLLQLLLEDSTGQPFKELVRELVFEPLNMSHSSFDQPPPPSSHPLIAKGHTGSGEPLPGSWYIYPELAAAGLWTTASDYARFIVELQRSQQGRSNKVLSKEMTQLMLSQVVGGETWGFGLGFFIMGHENARNFNIGGSNMGYRCKTISFLEIGKGAVVMTNGEMGEDLYQEILRSLSNVFQWPALQPIEKVRAKIDPEVFQGFIGEYRIPDYPDYPFLVEVYDNRLILNSPLDGDQRELYPESELQYFTTRSTRVYTFVQDPNGEIAFLEASGGGGQRLIARKV